MEIIVVWSDSAIQELRDIYDYFSHKAGKKVADNITNAIVDLTISLEKTPKLGQIEEMLTTYDREIRYLIDGNYKIVYLFEENFTTIATIFDCRQNPKKLKQKKI